MKVLFRSLVWILVYISASSLAAQSVWHNIQKPFPCEKDFFQFVSRSFFIMRPNSDDLAKHPEGAVLLFIHFDDVGRLTGAEYLTAGGARVALNEMGEDFVERVRGFECTEAVEYPKTLVIPIAFLPYPYFEYYQDPELKSEKTIYQLQPGLGRLLYDLDRGETFYVWDVYRFPMRYVQAKE